MQAAPKRTKSVDEPAVDLSAEPAAPAEPTAAITASDGGAKQALENEFECTICRVSSSTAIVFAAAGLLLIANSTE